MSILRLLLVAMLIGCGSSSSAELIVDLRTDFLSTEFASVRVEVFEALGDEGLGRQLFAEEQPVDDSDYYRGVRIVELEDLSRREYAVFVRLLDEFRDDLIPPRRVTVRVRRRTAATVLIMRDCIDIECPPTQTCIAGRCEDPRCVDGDELVCLPDECIDASGCTPPVDCASAECVGGWCFFRFADSACPLGRCDPTSGCATTDAGVDAFDAPTDVGSDASCPSGFADCNGDPTDGCEIDTQSDGRHCGECDNPCVFTSRFHGTRGECVDGTCRLVCFTPYLADCNGDPSDGCEADLSLPSNCGRCGNVCSGATPVCGVPPPAGPGQLRQCLPACLDPTPEECNRTCYSTNRGSFQSLYSPTYCNGCTGSPTDACEEPLDCCKGCCADPGTSGCVLCGL